METRLGSVAMETQLWLNSVRTKVKGDGSLKACWNQESPGPSRASSLVLAQPDGPLVVFRPSFEQLQSNKGPSPALWSSGPL